MKTLEERQFAAMSAAIREFAKRIGEDTIGVIVYTSGGLILSDKEIVELAHKIDQEKI